MENSPRYNSTRRDFLIAILIAIVSTTFALAAWRTSLVASSAGDADRQGILEAIQKQAFANENWQQVYEEANFAENYAIYLAEVEALEASGDPAAAAQAANLRQYLLPNLQLLAAPLATEPIYENPDGTYDLQRRFEALETGSPDLSNLDPQASFRLAERYYAEQRWLTVAIVLLAISLFWLAIAQISGKRLRLPTLVIGLSVYGLAWVAIVVIEVLFFMLRGGVL
ncbi:MAG: hypothetical protein AB1531_07800 [Chloroflexota bacterium]